VVLEGEAILIASGAGILIKKHKRGQSIPKSDFQNN
jgi:hypothetical protein